MRYRFPSLAGVCPGRFAKPYNVIVRRVVTVTGLLLVFTVVGVCLCRGCHRRQYGHRKSALDCHQAVFDARWALRFDTLTGDADCSDWRIIDGTYLFNRLYVARQRAGAFYVLSRPVYLCNVNVGYC